MAPGFAVSYTTTGTGGTDSLEQGSILFSSSVFINSLDEDTTAGPWNNTPSDNASIRSEPEHDAGNERQHQGPDFSTRQDPKFSARRFAPLTVSPQLGFLAARTLAAKRGAPIRAANGHGWRQ